MLSSRIKVKKIETISSIRSFIEISSLKINGHWWDDLCYQRRWFQSHYVHRRRRPDWSAIQRSQARRWARSAHTMVLSANIDIIISVMQEDEKISKREYIPWSRTFAKGISIYCQYLNMTAGSNENDNYED